MHLVDPIATAAELHCRVSWDVSGLSRWKRVAGNYMNVCNVGGRPLQKNWQMLPAVRSSCSSIVYSFHPQALA